MAGGVEEAGSRANRGRNFALDPLHYTTLHITVALSGLVGWSITVHYITFVECSITLIRSLHYITLHCIAMPGSGLVG